MESLSIPLLRYKTVRVEVVVSYSVVAETPLSYYGSRHGAPLLPLHYT